METGPSKISEAIESSEFEKRIPRNIQKYVLTFFNQKELRNVGLVNKNFNHLKHEQINYLNFENDNNLFIYIHGTTAVHPTGALGSRKLNSMLCPNIITPGIDPKLISLENSAKTISESFSTLINAYVNENNRYYYQWSGILSEHAWQQAANDLKHIINNKNQGATITKIFIIAHSHGGQVARLAAEKFIPDTHLEFHVITIATPLSIDPPSLMPNNVKTWLHYFHRKDLIVFIGSKLMQASTIPYFTRRIEGIFEKSVGLSQNIPCNWHSKEITGMFLDPHNSLLLPPTAKIICNHAESFIKTALSNNKQIFNEERISEKSFQKLTQ